MKKQIEMHCPKCGSANILTDDLECFSCGNIGTKSPHVKQRGGQRKNAGAKKGEPKKAVGVRVRIRFLEQCKKAARNEEQRLLELEAKQNGC